MKEKSTKFYGWRNVILLTIIGCITVGFIYNCISLYVVPVCDDLGLSRTEFALITSIGSLVSLVASITLGKVFGILKSGKKLIMVGVLASMLFLIFLALATNKYFLYISGIFLGILGCYLTTAGVALFLNFWFIEKKSTAIGIVAAGTGLGGTIGNILVGTLIEKLGWSTAALICLGIVVLIGVPATLFLADKPGKYGQVPLGYGKQNTATATAANGYAPREALKKPYIWMAFLAIALSGYSMFTILPNQAAIMTSTNVTVSIPLVISVGYGVCVLAKIVLGRIIDKLGVQTGVAVALICLMLSAVCIAFSGKSPVFAFAFAAFFAFGQIIGSVPIAATVDKLAGGKYAHNFVGVFVAFLSSGTVIASIITGKIFDSTGSYSPALWVSLGAAAIALVLLEISMKLAPDFSKQSEKV